MKNLQLLVFLLVNAYSYSQVGIGTTAPNSSAALDLTSTTKGFLPPRMTSVQMNAIPTPTNGLIVYCTDCTPTGIYSYNSPSWSALGGASSGTSGTAGASTIGDFGLFNAALVPTSGFLRQGTGPYNIADYPTLGGAYNTGGAFSSASFTGTGAAAFNLCYAKLGSTLLATESTNTYVSTNNGANWTSTAIPFNSSQIFGMAANTANFVFAQNTSTAASSFLYIYSSAGAYVTRRAFPAAATRIVNAVATSSGFAFSSNTDGTLYRTSDLGVTWTTSTIVTSVHGFRICVNGDVIIAWSPTVTGTLYRSTDGGATFTPITLSIGGTFQMSIANNGASRWVALDYNPSPYSTLGYISNDNGATWASFTTIARVASSYLTYDGISWVASTVNPISTYFTSPASGTVWTQRTAPNTLSAQSTIGNPLFSLGNGVVICQSAATTTTFSQLTSSLATTFSVPAVTEPSGFQYWVKATAP